MYDEHEDPPGSSSLGGFLFQPRLNVKYYIMDKLVLIAPVRLNSNRLHHKMLLPLGGKPLVQHGLENMKKTATVYNLDYACMCGEHEIVDVCDALEIPIIWRSQEQLNATDWSRYIGINTELENYGYNWILHWNCCQPFMSWKTAGKSISTWQECRGQYLPVFQMDNMLYGPNVECQQTKWEKCKPYYIHTANLLVFNRLVYFNPQFFFADYRMIVFQKTIEFLDINTEDDYKLACLVQDGLVFEEIQQAATRSIQSEILCQKH